MGRAGWVRIPLFLLYFVLLLELGCQAFWHIEYGIPFFSSQPADWYGIFFPGFRDSGVRERPPSPDDETLDVLLLGGSVLHNLFEHQSEALSERLSAETGRPVRLYDFSMRAHTSRDSLLKYRLLGDAPFDLVIVYHGINDARLNNVPAERFRSDYTHAAWYDKIEGMLRAKPWESIWRLPYTLEYAWIDLRESKIFGRYVPRNRPLSAWTRHGAEIKTEATFRSNLEGIVELAAERGQPVLLVGFAWYVPADYSLARFEAKQLDYRWHTHALEIWGEPEHVRRALEVHDRVLLEVADSHQVPRVDAGAAIPRSREYFDDACHLTRKGEGRWLDVVVPAAAKAVAAPSAG